MPRLRPLPVWWVAAVAAVVVAAGAVGIGLLLSVAGRDPATRIDAIRTGLGAAAGVGAAAALLLAFRRQRSTEITAANQMVTEIYTTAADQLGSDKAPVRLAGLYALERLAQDHPHQRQTIVNVFCAYLRMPYTPPDEHPPADDAPQEAHDRYEAGRQELQVRTTAQTILGNHLHRGAGERFWDGIDLNLTGAHLHDFRLRRCVVHGADFARATFTGFSADFTAAAFTSAADFSDATFAGIAIFQEATFNGIGNFREATFTDQAWFGKARFTGLAWFQWAGFIGIADFKRVTFNEGSNFYGATFTGTAWFDEARFTGAAWLPKVTFSAGADFCNATFTGTVDLDGACTRVASSEWPPGWTTRPPAAGEDPEWHRLVRDSDHVAEPGGPRSTTSGWRTGLSWR